jgi:hypothetical protein
LQSHASTRVQAVRHFHSKIISRFVIAGMDVDVFIMVPVYRHFCD